MCWIDHAWISCHRRGLTQHKGATKVGLHMLKHGSKVEETDVILLQYNVRPLNENGVPGVCAYPGQALVPMLARAKCICCKVKDALVNLRLCGPWGKNPCTSN